MEPVRPIHEVTLAFGGALLKASIWQHKHGDEPARFSVSFSRGIRPKGERNWVFHDYFRRDELLGLVRICEVSHAWVASEMARTNADSRGGTDNE